MADKTLTFAIMDAPYESARSTTAFRLMDITLERGYNVNVFAYEGAVSIPFALQSAHPNAVHGRDAEEEHHPLPKDWVSALVRKAEAKGVEFDWVTVGDPGNACDTQTDGCFGSVAGAYRISKYEVTNAQYAECG